MCQEPVPAESISTRPLRPRSSTRCEKTASAVGERQMLPRHTNRTDTRLAIGAKVATDARKRRIPAIRPPAGFSGSGLEARALPVDLGHIGHPAHARLDVVDLLLVLHVDPEVDARVCGLHVGGDAGGALVHLCDTVQRVLQQAGPVDADDLEVGREESARRRIPAHVHDPLALLHPQVLHVRTVEPVHGHAAAAGDIADDVVTTNGSAALGELRRGVDALDQHTSEALPRPLLGRRHSGGRGNMLGRQHLQHLLGLQPLGGHRQVEVVGAVAIHELGGGLVELRLGGVLRHRQVPPAQGALEGAAAALQLLLALLQTEVVANLLLRATGGGDLDPVGAGAVVLRAVREDLDPVTRLQLVAERDDLAVHARAHAAVAHLSVHRVGEVDGRRAARQVDHVAGRGEDEHALGEQVALDGVDEGPGTLGRIVHVDQLLHPAEPLLDLVGVLDALLICPVGGDTELGDLMHAARADLHLDGLALQANHRSVQRLVAVRLGHRHVILEAPRDGRPQRVDDAQRPVAHALLLVLVGQLTARLRVDDRADRHEVEDLVEVLAVPHHLPVNAVQVLGAARQLEAQALELQPVLEELDGLPDVRLALGLAHAHVALQLPVTLRLQVEEGAVLQLVLDVVDTQAVRQRREDLQRLARDTLLLVGRHAGECAHVVEPVGQLHEDDANVADHGEEHLAQVLCLFIGVDPHGQLGDLRLPLHDAAHRLAELLLDLLEGDVGVLDGVVQEAGGEGVDVHAHLGQNRRYRYRVGDVRLAGAPAHALVRLIGKVEGAKDLLLMLLRQVVDTLAQVGAQGLHMEELVYHPSLTHFPPEATNAGTTHAGPARRDMSTSPVMPSTMFASHTPSGTGRVPACAHSCPSVSNRYQTSVTTSDSPKATPRPRAYLSASGMATRRRTREANGSASCRWNSTCADLRSCAGSASFCHAAYDPVMERVSLKPPSEKRVTSSSCEAERVSSRLLCAPAPRVSLRTSRPSSSWASSPGWSSAPKSTPTVL